MSEKKFVVYEETRCQVCNHGQVFHPTFRDIVFKLRGAIENIEARNAGRAREQVGEAFTKLQRATVPLSDEGVYVTCGRCDGHGRIFKPTELTPELIQQFLTSEAAKPAAA